MNTNISADALRRAASIMDQIERLEAEKNAILAGGSAPFRPNPDDAPRRGRKPGPKPGVKLGRRPGRPSKVAAAEAPVAPAPAIARTKKKKRKLSPEARARIVAAVKARWARERGEA